MYFEKIKVLINSLPNRKSNIDFRFVEPFGGDPKCVVERVLNTSIGRTNKITIFDHKFTDYTLKVHLLHSKRPPFSDFQ